MQISALGAKHQVRGDAPQVEGGDVSRECNVVCIFDDDETTSELASMVSGLGYETCDGRRGLPSRGCVTALVSARFDPALRRVRELAKTCRVILVDCDNEFEFRLKAARAGVEAVLATPIDTVELGGWLADYAGGGAEGAPFSILIIDDDQLVGETYALALSAAGMSSRVISDPALALEEISAATPDLVLLDVEMPGADGLEVAQVIRQSRQALSMPIMFLSAERDAMRQQRARQIGGDDFISKPVDLDTLVSIVKMRAERAISLRQVMERDSLTGLLNHGRFKDRLALELERSRRTGSPFTVCLLDIDHFKQVNDEHGHLIGDTVIRKLSHCLIAALRRTDVIARYGGEEFGLILLDTPIKAAEAVMQRIRMNFAAMPMQSESGNFSVSFSAGIASSEGAADAHALIAASDAALYGAKRTGRNKIVTGQ